MFYGLPVVFSDLPRLPVMVLTTKLAGRRHNGSRLNRHSNYKTSWNIIFGIIKVKEPKFLEAKSQTLNFIIVNWPDKIKYWNLFEQNFRPTFFSNLGEFRPQCSSKVGSYINSVYWNMSNKTFILGLFLASS